jgi:DNA-binding GntR family transcriptional regulator
VLDLLVSSLLPASGQGSFIAGAHAGAGMQRILSFTEDMQQRGLAPSTTVMDSNILLSNDIAENYPSLR